MVGESRPSHIVLRCRMPAFANPKAHLGTWKIIHAHDDGQVEPAPEGPPGPIQPVAWPALRDVAEPTLYGAPVQLASDPTARVTRPDGRVRLVTLTRNANQAYVGTTTDTALTGVYGVDIEAVAATPAGITLKRYLALQAVVTLPGQGTGKDDGEAHEGGSYTPPRRPSLWCRVWRAILCIDCGRYRCRC